jgi:hypothetical protein
MSMLLALGSEYGTSKSAWQSFLVEAESVADIHLDVKNRLSNDVQNNLKQWRSDNYHKSVVGQTKETKQFDDEFKKVFVNGECVFLLWHIQSFNF